MANTSIGAVELELITNLVKFKLGMQQAKDEASRATNTIKESFKKDTREAKDALDLLSDAAGIRLPRELKKIIAATPGVGSALSAALGSAAFVAAISVVSELVNKIQEFRKAQEEAAKAGEKIVNSFGQVKAEGQEAILTLRVKLAELTSGPLTELTARLAGVREALAGLKLADDVEKDVTELGKSLNASMEAGLKEFAEKLTETLRTGGTNARSRALEQVGDQIQTITARLESFRRIEASNPGISVDTKGLENQLTLLQKIQTQIDSGLTVAATQKLVDGTQKAVDATKALTDERNKLLEQEKQLENTTETLLGKNLTGIDREIQKITEAIDGWNAYKIAWEAAHGGISETANRNLKALESELSALKAEAQSAADLALKAAALSASPLKDFKVPLPVYGGGSQAQTLEKLKTDAQAAENAADKLRESLKGPNEKLQDQIAILEVLRSQGRLTADEYERLKAQAVEAASGMSASWKEFGANVADTIKAGRLFGSSWQSALESIAIEFTQLILKMTLLKTLAGGSGGGGAGGFFGSLLGGLVGIKGHAGGGVVRAFEPVNVGEFGMERFVPMVSGKIIPHDSSDSSKKQAPLTQHFHMNISGVTDADSFRKSQPQIMADLFAAMAHAHQRNRG